MGTGDNDVDLAVLDEFCGVALGDRRLEARLRQIVPALAAKPDHSFPKVFEDTAALEGFYRFVENDKTTLDRLLAPHVRRTVERASEHDVVLAVHDTTTFDFSGGDERKGLGRLRRAGHGFLGHFSLLMSAEDRQDILGVAAVLPWSRTRETPTAKRKAKKISYEESRRLPNEQQRWGRAAGRVERLLSGRTDVIHVMDSEADDYALMATMARMGRRFVIRCGYDRVLDSTAADGCKLMGAVATKPVVCQRTVTLSRRRRPPAGGHQRTRQREVREATLSVNAATVVLRRPSSSDKTLPKETQVNVVHVWEESPPADVEPVQWYLLTTETTATTSDILRVVDIYRCRWTIEEYFKALKTGCGYEKRQLESYETLLAALGLFVPIALTLLRLRTLSRADPPRPATDVLTETQVEVLQRRFADHGAATLTVVDALSLVARMGGHLRRNGKPGWLVLLRGYKELLMLEEGFKLARETN
jgi:hypothetical protein